MKKKNKWKDGGKRSTLSMIADAAREEQIFSSDCCLPAGSELKHDSLIWENLLNKRLAEHCKSLPVGGREREKKTQHNSHLQHTRTNQFLIPQSGI